MVERRRYIERRKYQGIKLHDYVYLTYNRERGKAKIVAYGPEQCEIKWPGQLQTQCVPNNLLKLAEKP